MTALSDNWFHLPLTPKENRSRGRQGLTKQVTVEEGAEGCHMPSLEARVQSLVQKDHAFSK